MKQQKILLEASGSLTASFLIKSVQESGNIAVASDISDCAGFHLADEYMIVPKINDPNLWDYTIHELQRRNIKFVIPTFDETLIEWSKRKEELSKLGINVLISDFESLEICQDKWNTFNFFKSIQIPTPNTSLDFIFPLVKPRNGRGGTGIYINPVNPNMENCISQELLLGQEYTIDVLCNHLHEPIYIIPRTRMNVKDGKSIQAQTVKHVQIENYVREICSNIKFTGPINIQCFELANGDIKFTEINPRIAGGMALGFKASENWIGLMVNEIFNHKKITPKEINFGLKMMRYYSELFI